MATVWVKSRHFVGVFRPFCQRRDASVWVKRASALGKPIRAIVSDYADVFKELFVSSKKHPIKTVVYISIGSLIIAAVRKRPDYTSYVDNVVEYSNELSMCSTLVRSPEAKNYIDTLSTMHNDGYLMYINLGITSLIIRRGHSAYCSNYRETCPSLQPRFWTIHTRIVDVGVWGQWLLLDTEMKDYDVNETQLNSTM